MGSSRRKVRNLIFIIGNPDLNTLPPPAESIVVPLRWQACLHLENSDYKLDFGATQLNKESRRELIAKANAKWATYVASSNEAIARLNSYLSFFAVLSVMGIQEIVVRSLARFEAERVWLPIRPQGPVCKLSFDENQAFLDFHNWMIYATPIEICRPFATIESYSEAPASKVNKKSYGFPLAEIRDWLLIEIIYVALHKILKNLAPRQWWTNKCKAIDPLSRRVMVLSQRGKRELLVELLKAAPVSYAVLDDLPVFLSGEAEALSGQTVDAVLESYLRARDSRLSQEMPQIEALAASMSAVKILLTDHQYDAKTRYLIQLLTKKNGLAIAVFPEGAQAHTIENSDSLQHWRWSHHGVTHFVLNESDKIYHEGGVTAGSILITGYLGNTMERSRALEVLLGQYFKLERKLRALPQNSPAVFVSVDLNTSWSSPNSIPYYKATVELLSALQSSRYLVVAKFNHALMLKQFRMKFPNVLFFTQRVSWSALARNCEVVIQSDSSIGPEALTLRKPVIVWARVDTPRSSDAYSELESDVVRKVDCTEDLGRAIEYLIHSPKKDFHIYDRLLAQEQYRAVDWIKEKLADSSST